LYPYWNYPYWNDSEVVYVNESNGRICRRDYPVKSIEELKPCFPEITDWSENSQQIKNIKIKY
jgi:hypothetical protein